jgi:hypothetical protein
MSVPAGFANGAPAPERDRVAGRAHAPGAPLSGGRATY